jgi:hypothetical protein
MADRAEWNAFWASFHAQAAKGDPYLLARYEEAACVPWCVQSGTEDAWQGRADVEALIRSMAPRKSP